MIFWNMKYLFYNCQLLLLCCVCCKFAIQAFVQEDRQAYKQNLQKDWQFYRWIDRRLGTRRYFTESCKKIMEFCHTHRQLYRRTGTHRYFTKSCKKIMKFCHTHRRLYRWTGTRRYFTESCKKITEFFHTHRRLYRWTGTRRYFTKSCKKITEFFHTHRRLYRRTVTRRFFTESCKNITAPATITDGYIDAFTDRWRIFQSARLSDCLVGRHSYQQIFRWMRQIQCARALTKNYRRVYWRTSKNLEGFSKFWCENQLNTD